jgi:hypothetical protein
LELGRAYVDKGVGKAVDKAVDKAVVWVERLGGRLTAVVWVHG